MKLHVANAQREVPVDLPRMRRLARRAVRLLRIRGKGAFSITFIDSKAMQALNRRFKKHDRPTDVLSFRYPGELIVGDVLISPRQARRYCRENGVAYREELSRYVLHGLLHWLGFEDATAIQQRQMRARENELLRRCGVLKG